MIRYIYIVTVTAGLFMTISQQLCGRGEYLHTPNSGPDVCLPCGSETFMSEDNHVNRKCYNCTRIQTPDLEILTKSCNRTHDSVIACKEGYFRTNETCLPCRKCNFTARQCQNYSDAICCPGKNYVVSGNSCALVCEPGQYLNKSSKECFHCPNGTFRSEINHIFSKCNKCTTAEKFGNEVLKQPCNSTHDAVIRCREGYFWKYSVVPGKKGECDICSICIQTSIGRNCTETNNTICCQEADMDVVEEPSGHKCIKKAVNSTTSPDIPSCGEGQYLYYNNSVKGLVCESCKNGTYQDQANHTEKACKNCTEFKGVNLPQTCHPQVILENKNGENFTVIIIISSIIGVLVIVGIGLVFICCYIRRRQRANPEGNNDQHEDIDNERPHNGHNDDDGGGHEMEPLRNQIQAPGDVPIEELRSFLEQDHEHVSDVDDDDAERTEPKQLHTPSHPTLVHYPDDDDAEQTELKQLHAPSHQTLVHYPDDDDAEQTELKQLHAPSHQTLVHYPDDDDAEQTKLKQLHAPSHPTLVHYPDDDDAEQTKLKQLHAPSHPTLVHYPDDDDAEQTKLK